MDCGFYTVSLLAALACMGLAAWVLEWYTANRQYRNAYELLRNFPIKLDL